LFLENWMLFQPHKATAYEVPRWCQVDDVWLPLADGTRAHAWWMKEPDWKPENGAMLICHGNGGNVSHRGELGHYWIKNTHRALLLIDYPGFGRSEGTPTEAGCYAVADAAYDWLTNTSRVPS